MDYYVAISHTIDGTPIEWFIDADSPKEEVLGVTCFRCYPYQDGEWWIPEDGIMYIPVDKVMAFRKV